jgi:hypothetical protein
MAYKLINVTKPAAGPSMHRTRSDCPAAATISHEGKPPDGPRTHRSEVPRAWRPLVVAVTNSANPYDAESPIPRRV